MMFLGFNCRVKHTLLGTVRRKHTFPFLGRWSCVLRCCTNLHLCIHLFLCVRQNKKWTWYTKQSWYQTTCKRYGLIGAPVKHFKLIPIERNTGMVLCTSKGTLVKRIHWRGMAKSFCTPCHPQMQGHHLSALLVQKITQQNTDNY